MGKIYLFLYECLGCTGPLDGLCPGCCPVTPWPELEACGDGDFVTVCDVFGDKYAVSAFRVVRSPSAARFCLEGYCPATDRWVAIKLFFTYYEFRDALRSLLPPGDLQVVVTFPGRREDSPGGQAAAPQGTLP